MKKTTSLLIVGLLLLPSEGHAFSLFHATTKKAAERIMTKGFSVKRMNTTARFGKGIYMSDTKKLALAERPAAKAMVKTDMRPGKTTNISHWSKDKLKAFSHDKDLRGNIHRGIPGGDLGKKIGREAGKKGTAIRYPSLRGNGTNTFVPKKLYETHPRIVTPRGMSSPGTKVANR
jgi:hypothetical protein